MKLRFIFSLVPALLSTVAIADDIAENLGSLPMLSRTLKNYQGTGVEHACSMLPPNALKGIYGEFVTRRMMHTQLRAEAGWHSITPRSGPQGLDHLIIKTNEFGQPIDLVVGESKYGTSRLGMTKDGIQLGRDWTAKRIYALGSRYFDIAASEKIDFGRMPLRTNRALNVCLPGGKQRTFWKRSSLDRWHFNGSAEELSIAKSQTTIYGEFFQTVGSGRSPYRSFLNQVGATGQVTTTWRSHDATGQVIGIERFTRKLPTPLSGDGHLTGEAQQEIARHLQGKMPGLTDKEARSISKELCKNLSSRKLMGGLPGFSLINGGLTASASLDAGILASSAGTIDVAQASTFFPRATKGTATDMGSRVLQRRNVSTFKRFGGMTRNVPYLMMMYMTTDILIAVRGGQTMEELARSISVGLTGPLASWGACALAATFGAASTGTPLAALSGAALHNAVLAWFGGGSLAAGGGGMLVGGIVLGAITVVVPIIVIIIIEKIDQANEAKRIELKCDWLSTPGNLRDLMHIHSPHVSD